MQTKFSLNMILIQILVSSVVHARGHGPEKMPRQNIDAASDCVDVAGKSEGVEHACHNTLLEINKEFLKTKVGYEECRDNHWPSLDGVVSEDLSSIRFHPLKRGLFLLEIGCTTAAYNGSSVYFLYDERSWTPKKPAMPLPEILLFPIGSGGESASINVREFDESRLRIFSLNKGNGAGTFGEYREYQLDPHTYIPELTILYRSADNYNPANSYSYIKGKSPTGPDWKKIETKNLFGKVVRIDSLPRTRAKGN